MNALGTTAAGDPLVLDLAPLIGSHLCVAANSGGGKSGAIRKLLELTHGRVQHIVLDAEDEFYTLRERYDYVIAGGEEGDTPATVANASGLARAALENGFSLIAQLNDLGDGAADFIAGFLGSLISAPRALWRPLLLVIDEAQRFAPAGAPSEATTAIKALLQRGRKRGFTAVLATTRVSELNAGVRGLCNNWMLGLVGQALDRRTAADQLGFAPSSAEARGLQQLERRQFWGFGPALSRQPVLFRVADVQTTPVRPGDAKVPTPPAPEALREILAGLAKAPTQVEDQAAVAANAIAGPDDRDAEIARLRARLAAVEAGRDQVRDEVYRLAARLEAVRAALNSEIPAQGGGRPEVDKGQTEVTEPMMSVAPRATAPVPAARTATEKAGGGDASPAAPTASARKMIDALARFYPRALPIEHVAKIAGVSVRSSQWRANLASFEASGLVKPFVVAGQWKLTTAGRDAYGLAGKPDEPAALLAFWIDAFTPATGAMLRVIAASPGALDRGEVAARAGVSPTSSGLGSGLRELRDHGLIEQSGDRYVLAKVLR